MIVNRFKFWHDKKIDLLHHHKRFSDSLKREIETVIYQDLKSSLNNP